MENEFKGKGLKINESGNNQIQIKVGMIGGRQAGKKSLMARYIENKFYEDYRGPDFMEKTIKLRNVIVTLSIWDLGGRQEYITLIPLMCNDAWVFLFIFDLTRKLSLVEIRDMYRRAGKINKYAIPFLVGTKFDLFDKEDMAFKEEITKQARKFSKAMTAPLIYCSSSHSINVKKIFQLILAKVFHLHPKCAEITKISEPLVEYKATWVKKRGKSKSGQERKDE